MNPHITEVEAIVAKLAPSFRYKRDGWCAISCGDWIKIKDYITTIHAKHEAEKAAIVAEIQNRTSMSFLPMVQNESKFGTTEMHSNTVRFGYNLALSELQEKIAARHGITPPTSAKTEGV